jgi:MFS transporter, FHS family, L-fucose permease
LGRFTKTGSALLIMAISGGAILPLLYGKLSLSIGTREAYALMIPAYVYILYFATKGYKVGRRSDVVAAKA